ncbi:MAG: hypothetical protein ABIQ15_07055 [Nocardioides sp.]
MADDVFGKSDMFVGRRLATARVLESGAAAAAVGEGLAVGKPFISFDVLVHLGPLILVAAPQPVERSAVTVPISATGLFSDTVTYQDAADPTRLFWLPRYRLRTTPDDHYEVGYELIDGLWSVRFGLETYPAPEVEAAAAAAAVFPHKLTMVVTSGSSVVRTYTVAGLDPDDRGWTLSLRLALEERDALLRAFTSDDERASIEVRREITVAAPVLPTPAADDGPMVGPLMPGGNEASVLLPVINAKILLGPIFVPIEHVEPPAIPFPPAPDIQPIIAAEATAEVTADVELLRVARPLSEVRMTRLEANPDLIAVQPRARTLGFKQALSARGRADVFDPFSEFVVEGVPVVEGLSSPQPTPPPELFTTTTTIVSHPVPLRFDVATHPYLFPSGRAEAVASEYQLVALPWEGDGPGGRQHVYCQDLSRPDLFLYLPDAFLIGTLAQPPHGPELLFSVGRDERDPTRSIAVMSAHAVPQTSLERLADARKQLASHVPIRSGVQDRPQLEPMLVAAQGRLQLPGGTEIDDDDLDLINGWWISETFDYDSLQEAYAVLSTSDTASALLRGHVTVDVDDQPIPIPLEVRLDRPAVPALTWTSTRDADGGIAVTLRNVGPDPVEIPSVAAWLNREDDLVPAAVADPGWPVTLAAGAELALALQVEETSGPGGDDQGGTVALDLTAVRVEVTPEMAVERTLDRRVTRLPRSVRAMTTLDTLTQRDLSAIAVEFEDAEPVTVDATHLSVDVLVPVAMVDLLLGRSAGTYRFRQTLFPKAGDPTGDDDWRSTDRGLLGVPVS